MVKARSSEIKVRVTDSMKARIIEMAAARDESESVIVREALVAYLEKLRSKASDNRPFASSPAHETRGDKTSPH